MARFYPQAAAMLRIRWEDFATGVQKLKKDYELTVVPKSVSVTINSYREADKFTMELDYKSFPFDPRAIRALGVTICMEDMKKLVDENNIPVRIKPGKDNTVFLGFADEDSITLNETSRTVRIEGRDYTALLLDRPFIDKTTGKKPVVQLDKPVDQVITALLAQLEETANIKVENVTGETLPTFTALAPDFQSELSGQKNPSKHDKYWEIIQDIIDKAGLIAYIELDKLVISKPRVLYAGTKKKQMIYGKNLKTLEFKRKLGRVKGFNIEVSSLDVHNKTILRVRIPEEATPEWCASIGIAREPVKIPKPMADGQIKEENAPYYPFRIPGIDATTEAGRMHLTKVGESVYESVSRQEIEGSCSTMDMIISEEGKPFNIFKMRNGTPIAIYISDDDLEHIKQEKNIGSRILYLRQRGYSQKIADAFALTIDKFPTVFYTRSVEFTIDGEQGFSSSIDFINFIEAPSR